jgi:hypothetical protein
MSDTRNRAARERLVTAINSADMNAMNTVFTEDVVMEWPQSRDGRIARETAYWSKPFPAPEWRAPWVERM